MNKVEYEEKRAALEALIEAEYEDETQLQFQVDQIRALTFALRPNIKRAVDAVRQFEPEIVVFQHMTLVVAATKSYVGDDRLAMTLTMAYQGMREYYETAMQTTVSRATAQRHIEDAGLMPLFGKPLVEALATMRPMIERGWAAMIYLLDLDGHALHRAMVAGLTNLAYAEVIGPTLWADLGILRERVPRPGDPCFDFREDVQEAAALEPPSHAQVWATYEELVGEHGLELSREDDEDDEDDE